MSRIQIASVAAYYHISPLEVENWKTSQIEEWSNAAIELNKKIKSDSENKQD